MVEPCRAMFGLDRLAIVEGMQIVVQYFGTMSVLYYAVARFGLHSLLGNQEL